MELPEFILQAAMSHKTSVGNNSAFPTRDDAPFEYFILTERYKQVLDKVRGEFGYIPTVEEAENRLNKFLRDAMEIEKPLRPQLEKLCEATVNTVLGVPQETILLDCKLVGKVEPDNDIRIMPEDETGNGIEYTFDDVKNLDVADDGILRRRITNTMVQGASYLLMTAFYDNEMINVWSEDLNALYGKIIALNDFLLFTKKEVMTDDNPMLGAYVETHLGKGDEKTVISVQGLVYPFLLQETFRGFFELFASHGLPLDTNKANYIMHHADFIMAEAWDLRIGVPLWDRIVKCSPHTPLPNMYPYIMTSLVNLDDEDFNSTLKDIFIDGEIGKGFLEDVVTQVKHDEEYNLFKKDMERFNLEKCVINDEEDNDSDEVIE